MKLRSVSSIALMALFSTSAHGDSRLTLSIDDRMVGRFDRMAGDPTTTPQAPTPRSKERPIEVRLESGWIERSYLSAELESGGVELPPDGLTELPLEGCSGSRVSIEQSLGEGLRARSRAFVLLDACLSRLEVEPSQESDRIRFVSITYVARELGAVR